MTSKQESNALYKAIPDSNTELKDMKAPVIIINATGEDGEEIKQLDIKHKPTDFDDKGQTRAADVHKDGFIKFIFRRDVPQRSVFLSFAFIIIGLTLFFLGFNAGLVGEWEILFWGAGLVLFLPGAYFTFKIIQAYRTNDETVRSNILREIPEI